MDDRTCEVLGRLARWGLLSSGVLLSTAALWVLLSGFPYSVAASQAWSVTPDVVSRLRVMIPIDVYGDPPLRPLLPGMYWWGEQGRLMDLPVAYSGQTYRRIVKPTEPLAFHLWNVANPYSAHVASEGYSSAYLYRKGTQVVVLDGRCVLDIGSDRRLSPQADVVWFQRFASVPLARLAANRPLAYIVPVPLADYNRARRILRRAPAGAVLPGTDRLDTPPDADAIIAQLKRMGRRVGAWPILVTTDADLAGRARADRIPVLLVGSTDVDVAPGANVGDWDAAIRFLDRQP